MDVLVRACTYLSARDFIIIYEYKIRGCKKYVDEFRISNNISQKIIPRDEGAGVIFWKK
jgi:hypothetical protein